jgi:hypothetical protein
MSGCVSSPQYVAIECLSSISLLYDYGLHGIRHDNVTKAQLQAHEARNFCDKYLKTQFVLHSKHSHSHCKDQSVIAVQGGNSCVFCKQYKANEYAFMCFYTTANGI